VVIGYGELEIAVMEKMRMGMTYRNG